METRQRRSFTDDYKRQAVDLLGSSGRSIGSVAKELGLRDSVLRRWVELRGAGQSRRRRRGVPQRRRRCRRRTMRQRSTPAPSRPDPAFVHDRCWAACPGLTGRCQGIINIAGLSQAYSPQSTVACGPTAQAIRGH
jgi:transposase-like protein